MSDVQLVLSLGRADAVPDFPVADNVVVVPYAPQLQLLDKATMVITHAGMNTTLEGIRRGLPLLAIPVTNDQPGVARRLEWLGLGEVILPSQVTAPRLRALLEKILTTPKYRENANKYQQQMANGPGVVEAANLVEKAFTTRQRILRPAS